MDVVGALALFIQLLAQSLGQLVPGSGDLAALLDDGLHLLEGAGAEDTLRVDDADDDDVVDVEFFLDLVVVGAIGLVVLQHVFGIGIYLDTGELEQHRHGHQRDRAEDDPRPVHRKSGYLFEHLYSP